MVRSRGLEPAPSVNGNLCPIHNENLKCLSSVMHAVVYAPCVLWARSALLLVSAMMVSLKLSTTWVSRRPPGFHILAGTHHGDGADGDPGTRVLPQRTGTSPGR
jgi:hypothetical protein